MAQRPSALPALIVTLLLPATQILNMPKKELWYGANSVSETLSSVLDASLFRLNRELVSPLLYGPIDAIKYAFPALLGAALVAYAGYQLLRSRRDSETAPANGTRGLAAALAAIFAITLALHWLSFRTFHLLLPKDRTGLYLAPLALLIAGAVAAMPPMGGVGIALRRGLLTTLFMMAGYFLLCLRLDYFKQWDFEADVKDLYSVIACLNHDRGIRDVGTFWMYAAPFNYYRLQSGQETFVEFQGEVPYRPDQQVLVLSTFHDKPTLDQRGLKVVYHGKSTDAVIAVTPEIEASIRSSVCLERPLP